MQNNIKEEFISTLSHEIRTPLTSIKGFSQTMLSNWDKLNDDKKKEFLGIILSQSQRLINLVENVLNVAKIDSKSDNLVLVKVNATEIIKNCINLISINHKDFKFNFEKPKTDLFCYADNNKLQQILINILDNAVKYSKNSTKVDIKLSTKNDFIIFSIKNYGSFIEEDKIPLIFEKFYRLETYKTTSTQGSGLGLYIASSLAKNMQGRIEVKTGEENLETEFLIYIPIYEVEKMTEKMAKCIKQEF